MLNTETSASMHRATSQHPENGTRSSVSSSQPPERQTHQHQQADFKSSVK